MRTLYPRPICTRHAPAEPGPRCLHCHTFKRTRPRGLCRRCHTDKSIRKQYAPTSPHGRRMKVYPPGPRPKPRSPTSARPGSEDKILALQARVSRGLDPHHPRDAPMDPELRGLGVH
ncbi:MAG TPA: hypothetical protein VN692_09690 [Steroidobacteraceae bacterium]|nr:hypothetical protein [Steroidobacteraceae bacterium]